MSLAEKFSKRYAGLRKAYGTFTANNETREDGKASGKNITISKELFLIKTSFEIMGTTCRSAVSGIRFDR